MGRIAKALTGEASRNTQKKDEKEKGAEKTH